MKRGALLLIFAVLAILAVVYYFITKKPGTIFNLGGVESNTDSEVLGIGLGQPKQTADSYWVNLAFNVPGYQESLTHTVNDNGSPGNWPLAFDKSVGNYRFVIVDMHYPYTFQYSNPDGTIKYTQGTHTYFMIFDIANGPVDNPLDWSKAVSAKAINWYKSPMERLELI